MNITPINDTSTLKINISEIQSRKLSSEKVIDKNGKIPNGIYKVIRWEKIRQIFVLLLSFLIFMSTIILTILHLTIFNSRWVSIIIPIIIGLLALWKFLTTFIEFKWLKKAITQYREDLEIGLIISTPAFISRLYLNLNKKQVSHNWITFSVLFYGGIFTLLLWWLKDTSWWIFEFGDWIHSLFSNPTMMAWILSISLLLTTIIHIIFMVQRKSKLLDINAYFGHGIIPEAEVELIKSSKNKMYRRLFILSVMIVLIIPILVYIILKLVTRIKK